MDLFTGFGQFPNFVVFLKTTSGNCFCLIFTFFFIDSFLGSQFLCIYNCHCWDWKITGFSCAALSFCSGLKLRNSSEFPPVSPYPFLCVYVLTVDHSGTMDDREPLTHAIKSDSAVIGGNWDAWVIFFGGILLLLTILNISLRKLSMKNLHILTRKCS